MRIYTEIKTLQSSVFAVSWKFQAILQFSDNLWHLICDFPT